VEQQRGYEKLLHSRFYRLRCLHGLRPFSSPSLRWLRIGLRALDVRTIRQGFVAGGLLLVRAVQRWDGPMRFVRVGHFVMLFLSIGVMHCIPQKAECFFRYVCENLGVRKADGTNVYGYSNLQKVKGHPSPSAN
jgi:hypothetical protein